MSGEVLVTGSSGVLGWHLCRFLKRRGLRPVGSYLNHRPRLEGVEFEPLDLQDPRRARSLAGSRRWKGVIHTAAMTRPDECEKDPERTRAVNVAGTRALLEGLESGIPFFFISTDLIFDGLRGGYREEDEVGPPNRYAASKREAESLVQSHPEGVVLRMCKLHAPASPFHPSFESWLEAGFERGDRLNLFRDQYRTPIWVGDVARALECLLATPPRQNLYHLGGPERVSRYRFGQIFAQVYGHDSSRIVPVSCADHLAVPRGGDCSLVSSRFQGEYGIRFCPIRDGLERMRAGLY